MTIIIGILLAVASFAAGWIGYRSAIARMVLGVLASIALFLASTVIGSAATRTIMDDTIFMTEIHSVLQSATFLTSVAYLMVYGLSRIALQAVQPNSKR
ncbi:hypothetical protein [Paenibacillus radicis (ex Gao et al. 2016)]|uniref:Uncharacterized protein n=1 Tax=Paenibacillus radicis (ex Gao et al. 2016) TaxID=1737354 RepID=A0A917H494_9BACL|nr:hypothetical protein [Paenibacillus radicis (ex Gao et al. 2016)]GGG67006.1 hypothetical protein GCM10010918_21940 [Paenibacillus radicis (ex Gao et al. 2016)]